MRKKIFEMVEPGDGADKISGIYDYFMIIVIIASLIPLAFKSDHAAFMVIDKICVAVFIVDYVLRWITADYKFNKKSVTSFLRYPFSLMAVLDLLSILPSLTFINNGFKVFRVLRMVKALRVFKFFKYSRSVELISNVIKRSKDSLITVGTLSVAYILVSALIIFNVEPDSFSTFYEAVYWATVSLTTVGYGDISPVTATGRAVAMVSSIFGIAIVALPAGILTAGYMNEVNSACSCNGNKHND